MNIKLDNKIKIALSLLKNSGYEAYIVGGYLRDILLDRVSNDIDISTNALPSQIIQVFKDKYKVLDIGIKYGTISVVIDNSPIEITTYRSEIGYSDSRRPDLIIFEKNIQKDLLRRDFTINAMAYNEDDLIIDLFNARDDLNLKIIRCVGTPKKRFEEDKLRIIRAIRFASTLDFEIEEETFNAIKMYADKIKLVSIERINKELNKILLSQKVSKGIKLLKKANLLKEILPILDDIFNYDEDLFFESMNILDNTKLNIILRLSSLFYVIDKIFLKRSYPKIIDYGYNSYEITKKILKDLRYSNEIVELVAKLVNKSNLDIESMTKKDIRKLITYIGADNIYYLIDLQKAKYIYKIEKYYIFSNKIQQIIDEKSAFEKKDILVNGNDLKKIGYEKEDIGKVLSYLLEIILEDPKLNKKDILLEKAKYFKVEL